MSAWHLLIWLGWVGTGKHSNRTDRFWASGSVAPCETGIGPLITAHNIRTVYCNSERIGFVKDYKRSFLRRMSQCSLGMFESDSLHEDHQGALLG